MLLFNDNDNKSKGLVSIAVVDLKLSEDAEYHREYRLRDKMKRDRKAEDDYVRECGKAEGIAESILSFLGDLGDVPDEFRERILSETDPELPAAFFSEEKG